MDRLKTIYNGMKQRCYNQKAESYKYYGFKGIKICDEWLNDFKEFEQWALQEGYKDNLTIDRIDSDKDYCPDNCRWITKSENSANKKDDPESYCVAHWRYKDEKGKLVCKVMEKNLTRKEAERKADELRRNAFERFGLYFDIRATKLSMCYGREEETGGDYVSEREKAILKKVIDALPYMDEYSKGYMLGLAEGYRKKPMCSEKKEEE